MTINTNRAGRPHALARGGEHYRALAIISSPAAVAFGRAGAGRPLLPVFFTIKGSKNDDL